MSAVIVVTPLVIASWPVITAAITAAISTMGFSLAQRRTGTPGRPLESKSGDRCRGQRDPRRVRRLEPGVGRRARRHPRRLHPR